MTHSKQDHRCDLRDIRTRVLGYTQERMATALGISLRTYCRHEAGGPSRPIILLANQLADEVQIQKELSHEQN